MGSVIYEYRHHPWHPLLQQEVAAWAQVSQPTVSRIEDGSPVERLDRLVLRAHVLRIPDDLLWFEVTPPRTRTRGPAQPMLEIRVSSTPSPSRPCVAWWRHAPACLAGSAFIEPRPRGIWVGEGAQAQGYAIWRCPEPRLRDEG